MINRNEGTFAPKFTDKESLRQALMDCNISGEAARYLADLGRTGLHLLPIDGEENTAEVFSKLGGIPDLPEGMNWPIRPSLPPIEIATPKSILGRIFRRLLYKKSDEEYLNYRQNPQPYNFIAQISFEEMSSVETDEKLLLPKSGALYLFYDDVIQCWGFDPEDAVGFKVIYVPDISSVKRAKKPSFHGKVVNYAEQYVKPKLLFERPPSEGLHFEEAPISEADKEAYVLFDDSVEIESMSDLSEKPAHKVRGWSNNIQGPMEEECALVTSGINCGAPEGYNSPEAQQILDAPNEWVQLLQIDSDDGVGMMWCDAGMLYLWIKKSDLENLNFENTWLILQTT